MLAEDVVGRGADPLLEHAGVDGAEVGGELEVAVVEVGQRDGLAEQLAAGDGAADEEHRSRGAVVGALAGVLGGAAAELRPRHRQHVVVAAHRREVGVEGGEGTAELVEQRLVLVELGGVRVEAAERDVGDAELRTAVDDLRDELEAAGERRLRVRHRRRVRARGGLHGLRAGDGVVGGALDQRGVGHVGRELVVELEQGGLTAAGLRLVGRESLEAVRVGGGRGDGRRLRRVELRRDELADVEAVQRVVFLRLELREVGAEPAVVGVLGAGVLPDGHRLEVRKVGVRVADAVDDGELLAVPERLEGAELRVEAEVAVERDDLRRVDLQRRAERGVGGIAVGHERVEAVVAAGELEDDERAALSLGRGVGVGGAESESALEDGREGGLHGAEGDERDAALHEVPACDHVRPSSGELVVRRCDEQREEAAEAVLARCF